MFGLRDFQPIEYLDVFHFRWNISGIVPFENGLHYNPALFSEIFYLDIARTSPDNDLIASLPYITAENLDDTVMLFKENHITHCMRILIEVLESYLFSPFRRHKFEPLLRSYLNVFYLFRHRYDVDEVKVLAKLITVIFGNPQCHIYLLGRALVLFGDEAKNALFLKVPPIILEHFLTRLLYFKFSMQGYLENSTFQLSLCLPFCPVLSYLFLMKCDHFKAIVKYGFERGTFTIVNASKKLSFMNPLFRNMEFGVCDAEPTPRIMFFPDQRYGPASKRDYYAFEILCAIYNKNVRFCENSTFHCYLEYLWRTMPDPYISIYEFGYILRRMCGAYYNKEIQNICQEYAGLFPRVPFYTEPRSLQEQCRYSIRRFLRSRFQLPHGVEKLPISKRMKEIILLDFPKLVKNLNKRLEEVSDRELAEEMAQGS